LDDSPGHGSAGFPGLVLRVVGGQLEAAERARVAHLEPRHDAVVVVAVRARQPLDALAGGDSILAHRALVSLPFLASRDDGGRERLNGGSGGRGLVLEEHPLPACHEHLVRRRLLPVVGGVHKPVLGVGSGGGRRGHVGEHLPLGLRGFPGGARGGHDLLPLEILGGGGGDERVVGVLDLEAIPADGGEIAVVLCRLRVRVREPEAVAVAVAVAHGSEERVAEQGDVDGAEEAADAVGRRSHRRRRGRGRGGRIRAEDRDEGVVGAVRRAGGVGGLQGPVNLVAGEPGTVDVDRRGSHGSRDCEARGEWGKKIVPDWPVPPGEALSFREALFFATQTGALQFYASRATACFVHDV